jgi:Carboxypeptidase regulatory-like domain
MNHTPILRVAVFVLALNAVITLAAGLAYGQAISGNLVGTVVDPTDAAVANADVTATNVDTGVVATTKTNNTGAYRFENLPVGNYKIAANSKGFRQAAVQIEVQLNRTGTANIRLTPGITTETVEVSGTLPLIDTTSAQVQATYEAQLLQDLPVSNLGVNPGTQQNLGVLNLSLLDAGVASTGGLGAGSGPSVGGQRPRNNNFTVEGVDNNDKGVTGPLIYVPPDAVANFTVLQNQFNSEFGHSSGGQFSIVVKSGTNSFHGDAYEYLQNRDLNAIDQSLANQGIFKNPRFDSNRFGGQVGGPIVKNKLFFFANFEYNPIGLAAIPGSPLLAPTSAGYATLLAIPGVSTSNIQGLQKYAVAPAACGVGNPACPSSGTLTVNKTPVEIGVLPNVPSYYINYKALTTSMDYNISSSDQIRGRYIYNKEVSLDTGQTGVTLPAFFTPLIKPYHLVALNEYHTFSPTISNEFRVGFNRFSQTYTVPSFKFQNLDAFPNLTIDNLGGINVGPDPNAPQFSIQNFYQIVDNVTWLKGNHTLKFGFEGNKYITPQKFIQRSRGDYAWKTLEGFANDIIPDSSIAERSFGNVGYSGDQYGIYWYVNDIWKVRSNLSLNLGVRYEFNAVPFGWTQQSMNSLASVPGLITFAAPEAPKTDFMPRVGFAYSPGSSGNTSIRGGIGMGYDILYDNIGVLSRPPQIGSTIDCPTKCSANGFLANGGIPPQNLSGITILDQATARANTSSFLPQHVRYPLAISWNLGVQQVFAKNYTADIRYVGTRGEDLNVQNRINVIPVVTPTHFLPTYLQKPSQAALDASPLTLGQLLSEFNAGGFFDPAFLNAGFQSEIVGFVPWGSSTYHGLQTQLNKRMSNGLQFQVGYTWSHTIDNSTADFFSTIVSPRRPQDFRNLPSERSNSILDHAHRLTVAVIYDAPWYKHDSNWLKRNLLGNYEIAPVFTWESGQWGTVQSGTDTNLNTDGAPDRAIFNPAGVPGTGSGVTPLCTSSLPAFAFCGENDFKKSKGAPGPGNFNSSPYIVSYLANNPTAQYIVGAKGALSTGSRNTLQTPPINNWDVTVAKHIAITERMHFDLSLGALNILNHPQFVTGSVDQAVNFSVTGQAQRNYFIPSQTNFHNARLTFPSNARQLLIGAKFVF